MSFEANEPRKLGGEKIEIDEDFADRLVSFLKLKNELEREGKKYLER